MTEVVESGASQAPAYEWNDRTGIRQRGHTCIVLPFPPSVNGLFAGKARRYLSKRYKAWKMEAGWALKQQQPLTQHKGKVCLRFHFGRPRAGRLDLFNFVKAPEDLLVEHGLIEDDSLVVEGRVLWSDDVTGVMIEIEDAA